MSDKSLILFTNDDGFDSEGLQAIVWQFAQGNDVDVAISAPIENCSGKSHSLTLQKKWITVNDVELIDFNGVGAWEVEGTPADSVNLAIGALLPRKPDLVISGINHGANFGVDIFHSGTLGAAREAVLYGIPAIAVSHDYAGNETDKYDFDVVAEAAYAIIWKLELFKTCGSGAYLNINLPKNLGKRGAPKLELGVRKTRLVKNTWSSASTRIDECGTRLCMHGKNRIIATPDDEHSDYHVTRTLGQISVTRLGITGV